MRSIILAAVATAALAVPAAAMDSSSPTLVGASDPSASAAPAPRTGRRTNADVDGDGRVSLDEFKAGFSRRIEERFHAIDANGDGYLTKGERLSKTPRPERSRPGEPR